MSIENRTYHRRRAEIEMAKALCAREEKSAAAHLELARMHRAKRLQSGAPEPGRSAQGLMIFRTDKEA